MKKFCRNIANSESRRAVPGFPISLPTFGQIITSYGNNSRNKYIGKEKDVETAMNINFEGSLADHGVRKYEDYTGRFTTPEPLWEKYYSLSPYVYSMNNPI
jgi:RHS repeat-associated protein